MRKVAFIIALFTCVVTKVKAQVNLVKNPSFEQYSACPINNDQSYLANGWNGIDSNWYIGGSAAHPFCLADYINVCAPYGSPCTVPLTAYYYQYPRTGDGMIGFRAYSDGGPSGHIMYDYLQGKLISTLVYGKAYCVTFYVSLACRSQYANNKISAYFDDGMIDTTQHCEYPQTQYTPQVVEEEIITDTTGWTKIQGSFVANGTETFITIGNFSDTAHTAKITWYGIGGEFGGYLLDDVSVIASDAQAYAGPDKAVMIGDTAWIGLDSNGEGMPCYWYVLGGSTPIDSGGTIKVAPASTTTYMVSMDLCGTITTDTVTVYVWALGNKHVLQPSLVNVYPNPATTALHIDGAAGCDLTLYDAVGRVVATKESIAPREVLDMSQLHPAFYQLQLKDPKTGEKMCRLITNL